MFLNGQFISILNYLKCVSYSLYLYSGQETFVVVNVLTAASYVCGNHDNSFFFFFFLGILDE